MKTKFDVLVIGGGVAGVKIASRYQRRGLSCAIVEAKPGNNVKYAPFLVSGGTVVLGDRVVSGELADGRVICVRTFKGHALFADKYVLSTGKYASRGLVAEMERIYEPIFGLDVKYDSNRNRWFCQNDFWADQPFLHYGVAVNKDGHPFKDGESVENLIAVGDVLCDF